MEEELKKNLGELGLSSEQIEKLSAEGAVTREDVAKLDAGEIKAITGCGLVTAKKIVAAFAPVKETMETAIVKAGEAAVIEVLPALPEGDTSFIDMLKTGGVLKVSPVDVLGAVRAGIAANIGIDRIPGILLDKMEAFAESQEEPASDIFYKLMKIIAARSYAEVLSACGVSGHFMSDKRKRDFLAKLDTNFWKTLVDFQAQLEAWWDLWASELQGMSGAMLALKGEKTGAVDDILRDMAAAPDSSALRAAAEVVINRINKVFAGAGIPVERALAYDATKVRELLDEKGLPEAIGCSNKEQMLKAISQDLGTAIEADYVDFEKNVAIFILGIMKLNEIAADKERKFIIGLRRIGRLINWEKLGVRAGGPTSGSGSFRGR